MFWDTCLDKVLAVIEKISNCNCINNATYFLHNDVNSSLQVSKNRKFNPKPNFLSTAEAYFVCNICPIFQISLIYAFIGCPWIWDTYVLRENCENLWKFVKNNVNRKTIGFRSFSSVFAIFLKSKNIFQNISSNILFTSYEQPIRISDFLN